MIRPILKYGDQTLHERALPVGAITPEIDRLIEDMIETMYAAPGIGLAAPQVGVCLRIFVIDLSLGRDPSVLIVMINPEFVERDGVQLEEEGCLSVPGLRGDVERHEWITVKARDDHGHEKRLRAEGWFARCIQHEIDHLDGILYTDKATDVRYADEEEICTENAEREALGEKVPVAI